MNDFQYFVYNKLSNLEKEVLHLKSKVYFESVGVNYYNSSDKTRQFISLSVSDVNRLIEILDKYHSDLKIMKHIACKNPKETHDLAEVLMAWGFGRK